MANIGSDLSTALPRVRAELPSGTAAPGHASAIRLPTATAPEVDSADNFALAATGATPKNSKAQHLTLQTPGVTRAVPRSSSPELSLFLQDVRSDLATVEGMGHRLESISAQIEAHRELFTRNQVDKAFTVDEVQTVLGLWSGFYEAVHALELVRIRYDSPRKGATAPERTLSYIVSNAALSAQALHCLRFERLVGSNAPLAAFLDQARPELAIPLDRFLEIRTRISDPLQTLPFLSIDNHLGDIKKELQQTELAAKTNSELASVLDKAKAYANGPMQKNLDETHKDLGHTGTWRLLTGNLAVFKHWLLSKAFPAQKDISEWMGDFRIGVEKGPMIALEQAEAMTKRMQPGDVMVARQNWFLSNAGLPGFWPHAELYIGSPSEFAAYFDDDPGVRAMVLETSKAEAKKNPKFKVTEKLTELLAQQVPDKWETYTKGKGFHGEEIRIIESISEGVSFTGIKHGMVVDYLGVMRPNVSKADKAVAMIRAFGFQGLPYDFDFDFATQDKLVCTELVWDSYRPGGDMQKGLEVPLVKMAGRVTLPANSIVEYFDRTYDKADRPVDFVGFLDGTRSSHSAGEGSVDDFRKTFHRPKWTVFEK